MRRRRTTIAALATLALGVGIVGAGHLGPQAAPSVAAETAPDSYVPATMSGDFSPVLVADTGSRLVRRAPA